MSENIDYVKFILKLIHKLILFTHNYCFSSKV